MAEEYTVSAENVSIAEVPASDNGCAAGETVGDGKRSTVGLRADMLSVFNYALQQNRVKIVRFAEIENRTDVPLCDVTLEITAEPAFCLPSCSHIDLIPAKSTFRLDDIALIPDGALLAALTERCEGRLTFRISAGNELLYAEDRALCALAFDEWHGSSVYPELLCAFVTPNHPEVVKITARAAELLDAWTSDPSLDGYQSRNADRILKMAAAVYGAIQEQNIVYSVPPASFEAIGQRVRLCDAVMRQKLATCLDFTLFYAAALEGIGLHPLLILKKGHIFAGVWLDDLTFSDPIQDDASLVTKRIANGVREIAVVECTAMAAGKNCAFDDAAAAAEASMTDIAAVECIIDVSRARMSGIRPMPVRVYDENGWHIERDTLEEDALTAAPKEIRTFDITADTETPASRRMRWERKLLDLGMRNTLINLRPSKNLVPILTTSLDDLENALSDDKDFEILPRPADFRPDGELNFDTMHEPGAYAPVIQAEFKNRRLRSPMTEGELSRAMRELYRTAKTALEENGANTLYLALGLLRWYENPRSTKPRYAPLILIPVEMVRHSAAQGCSIRLRDDEPQMNITLLEKISQDFGIEVGGVDPLPLDSHGIDTRKVFTILRMAVMGQKNWDILESAYLGIFSFSQFVMWNDIRSRTEELAQNKIVRSLMDGRLSWNAEPMEIGERVSEDDVLLPLPADASQLFAIEAASRGESFVLHGPPGTGKSQTITALIANALAGGKTVLFVAEKMAALEVVQKRLEKIGLGPFCLELHSNKSKKRDVLGQLQAASEVVREKSPKSYAYKAEQIAQVRRELDSYASALHTVQPCGETLYSLIGLYEDNRFAEELPAFDGAVLDALNVRQWEENELLLARAVKAGCAVGHPAGHPLTDVGCTLYTQRLRSALPGVCAEYRAAVTELRDALLPFAGETGLPADSWQQIGAAASLAGEMMKWFSFPSGWARIDAFQSFFSQVNELCTHARNEKVLYMSLAAEWKPEFFSLDANALLTEYRTAEAKWALPRLLAVNAFVRRLSAYSVSGVRRDKVDAALTALVRYQAEAKEKERLYALVGRELGDLDTGKTTEWENVRTLCASARDSAKHIEELSTDDTFRAEYCGNRKYRECASAVTAAWERLTAAKREFDTLLSVREHPGAGWFDAQRAMCAAIEAHTDDIKEWITWNAAAEEAENAGLTNVVNAYRAGMAHEAVLPAYRRAAARDLIMRAIDASPVLNRFSGVVFDERIAQFSRLNAELTELAKEEIYCRLAAKIPNFAKEAAQSSELGILQKAIRSGGRGLSIRRLFEQLPTMLPRLCPCMLMSPISAAQYLDPKREPFDLVVFDEASQLPTCKAVGALARGKDAVIVGDPNQMPPTSFFAVQNTDEDALAVEDLESILDDCLALNLPQTHLLWHYRSRHESLIAFSNRQFYQNKLYTFPSVNDREDKVTLVHVDGVFERGKTRQNRAEAEAIIEELKRRCHDPALSAMSVGVVTFNINQQNLIDDMLIEACREDTALEKWAYNEKEPLFIKNLENVQGDERDVILFSVGYGPDADGHISLNFGPLNRDGGWRRLNVAVTRARCEMKVFSTLSPDEIDLTRTSAEGVAALKAFLEYAGGGKLCENADTVMPVLSEDGKEGIAGRICAELALHGYQTVRGVGHSAYRIDVGVIDPEEPETYLLGIMLDGQSYAQAKTTYDRELAQINVLEGLGWHILRIWTMDWWDNTKKELDRILSAIEERRAARQAACTAAEETVPVTDDEAADTNAETQTGPEKDETSAAPEEVLSGNSRTVYAETKQEDRETLTYYRAAVLPETPITAEELCSPRLRDALRTRMLAVLAAEAPVAENVLYRKTAQSFGITRSGSRLRAAMEALVSAMQLPRTEENGQTILWNAGDDPASHIGFRISGEGADRRDAKEIPLCELVDAAVCVLYEQAGMTLGDLVRETAKLMNCPYRVGTSTAAPFEAAADAAVSGGLIARTGDGMCTLTPEGSARAERMR